MSKYTTQQQPLPKCESIQTLNRRDDLGNQRKRVPRSRSVPVGAAALKGLGLRGTKMVSHSDNQRSNQRDATVLPAAPHAIYVI